MSGWQSRSELSREEEELAARIHFDEAVLRFVKKNDVEELQQLTVTDWNQAGNPFEAPVKGLAFSAYPERARQLLSCLRKSLQPKGYLVFLAERGEGDQPDKVAIIQGTDQYAIPRTMKTDAPNHDLTNHDIITWLKKCQKRYPFDIIGAGRDWVETRLHRLPDDVPELARQVEAFSPDVVSQGVDTLENLARAIRRAKGFYLWWD